MLKNSIYARIVACAAGVAMVLPAVPVMAAPQAAQHVFQGTDVVLVGGKLTGRVVTANGRAIEGAVIKIAKNGQPVAQTVTKADGSYSLAGLANGTHSVTLGDGQIPVRLWSKEAAPTSAMTQLTLSQTVVRGQDGESLFVPFVVGGVLVTTLVIAVIALDKVNDLQDEVDALQTP